MLFAPEAAQTTLQDGSVVEEQDADETAWMSIIDLIESA